MKTRASIEQWASSRECCDSEWEEAYARFETPEEETRKFVRRLRSFGVDRWDKDLRVVELFCGRGSGLAAWHGLGFSNLEGVDLSGSLLRLYTGRAQLYLGDCRCLRLPDASRDIVCVQGGLHHLPALTDVKSTVMEACRILQPGGRLIVIEPWKTPFLRMVHGLARRSLVRRAWGKFDALACMIDREQETYLNWLSQPAEILAVLTQSFKTELKRTAWGKLSWLGRKRPGGITTDAKSEKEMQSPAEHEVRREGV